MSFASNSIVFSVAALAGPLLALKHATPVPGELALVVGPPWASSEALVTENDGKLIGPYSTRFGALAVSEDPAFFKTVRDAGAWFVLDGTRLAQLCGVGK